MGVRQARIQYFRFGKAVINVNGVVGAEKRLYNFTKRTRISNRIMVTQL